MAQSKIQAYMERHKLGPLFEDLMNKVLRDMPEEPLIYLLRTLYKKTGMEIPQDIRYGGLRKSVDLVRSRSPERSSKGVLSASDGAVAASRDYDKPWITSQARRMKPRKSADEPEAGRTGKKRPEWQGDTKVTATSFDELWEDHDERRRESASPGKRSRPHADPRSSWAAVGLEGGETFTSGNYQGPSHHLTQVNQEDLLAAEIIRPSVRNTTESAPSEEPVANYRKGQRLDHERHCQELENILHSGDKTSSRATSEPPVMPDAEEKEEEAIELLEDAEDLLREGVKNVPASGYKLSRVSAFIRSAIKWQNTALRERSNEPYVKLNINLSPRLAKGPRREDSMQSFGGYESDQENESPPAGPWESDEEFESVSQVTGPRHPVWQVPDSDAESAVPRGHKGRSKRREDKRSLLSTAPASVQRSALRPTDLDPTQNLTWSPGLVQTEESSPERDDITDPVSARSGGWVVPDDSDAASVHDWNQRVKGGVRDPRAY